MEYFLTISSIIIFIENRIQEKIDYKELERATGFSTAHIRDLFVRRTGIPLAKYILTRKIANAAYEILYNHQSVIHIASKYGFSNHDTFTRAFKRITGLTPTEFKKKRPPVGRIKLCAGVFGIGLLNPAEREDDSRE